MELIPDYVRMIVKMSSKILHSNTNQMAVIIIYLHESNVVRPLW